MSRAAGGMHVAKIERRHGERVYTSHLIRRSVREGKRVRHETIANVSKLPAEAIEALKLALAGEALMPADAGLQIENPLPAGHVQATLAMARRLDLARLIDRQPSRERELVVAMVLHRVLEPSSKLQMARSLSRTMLAQELSVEGADQDDLYAAMDWLVCRQQRIEDRLARRHIKDGELVLYDVSSSYFEGRTCELAQLGYSRDGKRGTLQIIYGLLCDRHGRPVAVEVFEGSLHDDKTLPCQIEKLTGRFHLKEVVVVADRGMITKANIETLKESEGLSWITALKSPQIKKLVKNGDLQPSLFDQQNLAEITSEDYPGERLVVCRNPLVGAERQRKREDLLRATERELDAIKVRVKAGTLKGKDEIALAVGPALKGHRVKKHFEIQISDDAFTYSRKSQLIEAEAALDGFYVLRTSVPPDKLDTADVVRSYKQLKEVERDFKTIKGPELEIRPIAHRLAERVRAHVFLCMLSCYLARHLKQAWAELLFKDECPPVADDPVAKAQRSPQATRKAASKRTASGEPCHSFRGLIAELARRTQNTVRIPGSEATFTKLSEPNALQARALDLARTASIE